MLANVKWQCRPEPSRSAPPGSGRTGAASIEFTVVLMFLFVPLMLGMFELSRVMWVAHILDDAARAGCRTGISQGKANTDVQTTVQNIIKVDSDLPSTLTVNPGSGAGIYIQVNGAAADVSTAKSGDKIQVKVSINTSDALKYWPNQWFTSTVESQFLTMMKQGS